MRYFRVPFRIACTGILVLLLAYWSCLISYSLVKLIAGGPAAVIAWYAHIATEGQPVGVVWSGKRFVIGQIFLTTVTLAAYLGRRMSLHSSISDVRDHPMI
jgi:hypothetical protein